MRSPAVADLLEQHPRLLTYDLMMTPSVVNNYVPYLLTNRSGQVVLNPKMAAAARKAGLKTQGGSDLTLGNRNAFLEALAGQGYLSQSLVETIKSAGEDGYSFKAGLGGQQLDKNMANAMNINNLMTYSDSLIKNKVVDTKNEIDYKELSFEFGKYVTALNADKTPKYATLDFSNSANKNQNYLSVDGSLTKNTEFDLADLFDKDIVFSSTGGATDEEANKFMVSFVNDLYSAFSQTMGVDEQSKQALKDALGMTIMSLSQQAGGKNVGNIGSAVNDGIKEANKVNGWYTTTVMTGKDSIWEKIGKIALGTILAGPLATVGGTVAALAWVNWSDHPDGASQSISLSNLARSFLTYYAQSMSGFTSGYGISEKSKDSVYVTDDLNYMFAVKNENSACNQKELLTADFYNMLFNNICVNGWTESNNVDDKNYLSHALKNGQLFVSALNTDNYFYQDHYTKNGRVIEVKDDDAIARAELEYSKKKTKLNYKEQMLDVKMKNIDMELSSLTTEYDAVKNLISKNVEKTFALFQ